MATGFPPPAPPPPDPIKSFWDALDSDKLTAILAKAGILDDFAKRVAVWQAKVPPGIIPNQALLNQMLADALAAYPGALRNAIDAIKPALFALVVKGKSPVHRDRSALA